MAKSIFCALAVIFIIAVGAVRDDSCPDEKALAPCTCDGEGVICMGKLTLDQIRKSFSAKFKYGGVRAIWIQGTPVTSAPADLIGQLMVQDIYIEVNNITTIDLKLLDGAQRTLVTLSLYGNKISKLDFDSFTKFVLLRTLNLGQNELTSIPAYTFQRYRLETLILSQNKIADIGAHAFDQMNNIRRLDLLSNQLKTLGPNSFSITSRAVALNLAHNQISEVSPSAFNGSAPDVLILTANNLRSLKYDAFGPSFNRGTKAEVSSNPFSCSGCDYGWVVDNKHILANLLFGFVCQDGTTLPQLTRRKIGC